LGFELDLSFEFLVFEIMIGCVFCQIVKGKSPAQIVYEDEKFMAFLDKYQQTRGHLQLIPKRHYQWVYDMPDLGNFFEVAQKIIRVIIPVLGAKHVTLATFGHEINHAHLWIVPQYGQVTKVCEEFRQTQNVDSLAKRLKATISKNLK